MDDLTLANLLKLEHDGWQSLCRGQGGTFYGRLMVPDAVMVLEAGAQFVRDPLQTANGCARDRHCTDNGVKSAG